MLNSAAEGCRFPNFREGYVGVVGYGWPVVTGVYRYAGARCQSKSGRQVDLVVAKKIIAQIKINHDVIVVSVVDVIAISVVVYINENSSVEVMLLPPVIDASEADGLP